MVAPPLTPDMLDRFGEALLFAGAPLGDELQPGSSDAEIVAVGDSLGVIVPPELRTLWRWGRPPEVPKLLDYQSWGAIAGFQLWPPGWAVKRTGHYREFDESKRSRIAFGGVLAATTLLVDTDVGAPLSPVLEVYRDDPIPLQVAPSIGALIQLWTEQMLTGDYWYDDRERRWLPEDGPMMRIIEGS